MRIEIKQEMTGIVLEIQQEEEGNQFGTEMLRRNKISGFLGATVHVVNQCPTYRYEIGDKISLFDYMDKHKVTRQELKHIMEQLMTILEQASQFFLSEKDLFLQGEYLFVEEKTMELSVVYLDEYNCEVAEGIGNILEGCMERMNHQDKELSFFVYGLHRIVKEKTFSLYRIRDYMDSYQYSEGKMPKTPEKKETEPEQKPKREENVGDKKGKGNLVEKLLIVAVGILFLVLAWKSEILLTPVTGQLNVKKTVLYLGVLATAEGYALYHSQKGADDDILEKDSSSM